jgi:alkanesulfonate monooxygenase SsuD/methylene tetrahydromethanopterin reductase-like flavin-dependent oxidoreductase (luciferase family)
VSLRSYPHDGLEAVATIAELRVQAALAVSAGFDGVMTSEHHAGFAGYLPNPLQLAGFLLDAMPRGWAAPCPLLLPLRAPAIVAEETAWLAARFPGRVGLGVAAGALPVDFEVADTNMDDLPARFTAGLTTVARLVRGETDGPLARDAAIARCREHPIPILSAAASATAARRAAANGCGLLFDSLSTTARCRELADAYRAAGGDRPVVLVRRCWLGEPPAGAFDRQVAVYRGYAPGGAAAHWGRDELAQSTDPAAVADRLLAAAREAGADALNLRVHVPGIEPADARHQIEMLGEAVVPKVRDALAAAVAR